MKKISPENPQQYFAQSTTTPLYLLKLTSEISARIVQVSDDSLDAEIIHSLRDILAPLGVDRGGLLEVQDGSQIIRVSHAWYAEDIEHVSGEINLAELFPWTSQKLLVEGEPMIMDCLDALPPEAAVDRQSHVALGTKSSLAIPLFIGLRVHHIVTVNAQKVERAWSDEIIDQLRLLGEIFVSALQRREADQILRRTKARLDMSAASANTGLWELNLTSGLFWATDKALEMFGFSSGRELSLEQFLKAVHPDDHELIRETLANAQATGEEFYVEYRASAHVGDGRWMNSRGRLQAGEPSLSPRIMGVTLDITKRKQMELQLQEQLQEIESLRSQLEEENTYLRNEAIKGDKIPQYSGTSPTMQAVMAQVEQVARTDSTVLIQGETGTGKELIAQTIHRLSGRGKQGMVKVNCAALPAALVESELFGREKGAYTGALSKQAGRFELADGSTIFLDEIAEMPPETQAKLLRVLQEGEFERLGSPRTIKVNVRIIAASNRDLAAEVEQGRFRRDLYYRLNIFPVHVPPLKERREDIPQLVWEFVNELGERMGKKIRRISNHDMEMLKACPWPGNIRELRNVIEHALIISKGETLELRPPCIEVKPSALPVTLEEVERRHILSTLRTTQGRIKGAGGASELLGINPSTLYSRMRKLGINAKLS